MFLGFENMYQLQVLIDVFSHGFAQMDTDFIGAPRNTSYEWNGLIIRMVAKSQSYVLPETSICFDRNVHTFGAEAPYVRSRKPTGSEPKTHCFGAENPLLRK